MDLNFILSLEFNQTNLQKSKLEGIPIAEKSQHFNVVREHCISGIFQHSENKKLFFLVNNGVYFIGILGSNGFTKNITIDFVTAGSDVETMKDIIKMVVKKYTRK